VSISLRRLADPSHFFEQLKIGDNVAIIAESGGRQIPIYLWQAKGWRSGKDAHVSEKHQRLTDQAWPAARGGPRRPSDSDRAPTVNRMVAISG
jgi:hypothetical protein